MVSNQPKCPLLLHYAVKPRSSRAAATGLRRTDLELLREPEGEGWRERGLVRVRRVAQKLKGEEWSFNVPKTESGKRDIHFPAHIYHLLVDYFEAREKEMRVAGVVTDLAFPSPAGLPMASGTYNHGLKQVLKRAGIKGRVTAYSLRYSFATLALLAGELDKTVSEQMGHTRVNFTKEVYAKVLPEMRRSLSDKLERLLFADARTRLAHSESAEVM